MVEKNRTIYPNKDDAQKMAAVLAKYKESATIFLFLAFHTFFIFFHMDRSSQEALWHDKKQRKGGFVTIFFLFGVL